MKADPPGGGEFRGDAIVLQEHFVIAGFSAWPIALKTVVTGRWTPVFSISERRSRPYGPWDRLPCYRPAGMPKKLWIPSPLPSPT